MEGLKKIHYVDDLSTKSITIKGYDTATFSEEQNTFCGLTIKVKDRKEFATHLNGRGAITCEKCINKLQERDSIPFDCVRCKKILEQNDVWNLRNTDLERLCVKCKKITD
jgi:hypothetical protein